MNESGDRKRERKRVRERERERERYKERRREAKCVDISNLLIHLSENEMDGKI